MTNLVFKTRLAEAGTLMTREDYLTYLARYRDELYLGNKGVYLGRKINFDRQELYFPFIDIDGDRSLDGDWAIESAIHSASLTYATFKRLGVQDRFFFIATGGTGFRTASNMLFDLPTYLAFARLVKTDMCQIRDRGPTEDLTMAHQLFAYKGHEYQNHKSLVNRHSHLVPNTAFEHGTIAPSSYKEITAGPLDPDEVAAFMERFLDFRIVVDMSSLGAFGKKLRDYKDIAQEFRLNTFNRGRLTQSSRPLSLQVLYEKLKEKYVCAIEDRKYGDALSFGACPVCGKTTSNAVAFPPHYRLKCFNTACRAHKGLSLVEWAGISRQYEDQGKSAQECFSLTAPTEFETIDQARGLLHQHLPDPGSSLFVLTAGVGKTAAAIEAVASLPADKTVLYSCYNKALQNEAYEACRRVIGADRVHKLQSREDLCLRKDELLRVTRRGYSPAEFLCGSCDRTTCQYYSQRHQGGPGIFLVTHHMLRFLERYFPAPDLIMLDEDIVKGFLLRDGCTEHDLRTLASVLSETEYLFVKRLLEITAGIEEQQKRKAGAGERVYPLIINARRLSTGTEDSLLGLLANRYMVTESEMMERIDALLAGINRHRDAVLYQKGVSLKAVNWIRGIVSLSHYPYVIAHAKQGISFHLKYKTPLGYPDTPVKVLDATGDKRVVESLLGRPFESITSDVRWNSRRVHIKNSTGRMTASYWTPGGLEDLIRQALSEMTARKVMVVTYKDYKKMVLGVCTKIDPSRDYCDYHFMGPRGINSFRHCDGVLVVGLPYPNINSSRQDAHILFPSEEESDLRTSWAEASMMWELVQNVHRIRPVLKEQVELVIVGSHWPSVLPEPDKVIDRSQSTHWKEMALHRLQPFVREFGFLTPDIGFLANVYPEAKAGPAHCFTCEVVTWIRFYLQKITFGSCLDLLDLETISDNELYDLFGKEPIRTKLINGIYNTYTENLLQVRIFLLQVAQPASVLEPEVNFHDPILLSNDNQWAELVEDYRQRYPHFETFTIRLPHAHGQKVKGTGIREQVQNFYRDLSACDFFKRIKIESYQPTEMNFHTLDPIPPDFLVVYIPPEGLLVSVNSTTCFEALPVKAMIRRYERPLREGNMSIITNRGKLLAQHFIEAGLRCEIEDVALHEKLIRNTKGLPKEIDIEKVLAETYGKHLDGMAVTRRMFDVWEQQQTAVDALKLSRVVELEKRVLWVIAAMELRGIAVDAEGLQRLASDASSHEGDLATRYLRFVQDGRFYNHIDQLGTVTGRLGSELDNIPKKGLLRSLLKAKEGYTLVVADYAAEEVRVLFGLADDTKGIACFKNGKDFYVETAMRITGKRYEDCVALRDITKGIVLGLNNGRTVYGIYQELHDSGTVYTVEQVQSFINRYFEEYSDMCSWRERVVAQSREKGMVTSALGRIQRIHEFTGNNALYNYPIQGTAADGLKLALILLDEKLQGMDAYPVLTLHDEIVVEARDAIVDEVAAILQQSMKKAFKSLIPNVPFKVKVEIRDTWGK